MAAKRSLCCHSGLASISGVPEIDTLGFKSATADLVSAKSRIHSHERYGAYPLDLWLWIPGSPLRGAPE
jgi:hypothetical protein